MGSSRPDTCSLNGSWAVLDQIHVVVEIVEDHSVGRQEPQGEHIVGITGMGDMRRGWGESTPAHLVVADDWPQNSGGVARVGPTQSAGSVPYLSLPPHDSRTLQTVITFNLSEKIFHTSWQT